jgi:hypothetical protein
VGDMVKPPLLTAAHHYVPRFYLKGFTDKQRKLWVYEQAKALRPSKPKDEAHRENYYVFTDRGYPDDQVEKLLSKAESLVAPVICKLRNPQFRMTEQQRNELYTFIAMTFVRVPAYRDFVDRQAAMLMSRLTLEHARDAKRFRATLEKYEAETGDSVGDYEQLRQFILGGNYEVSQKSAGYNLKMAFESGLEISELLETDYEYDIWYAPQGSFFITCDNPVITIEPDGDGTAFVGTGFARKNTEVLFPLNQKACLRLRRGARGEQLEIDERRSQQINDLVMGVAQRFLYAPGKYKRISRLFNERGCKLKYGDNALIAGQYL